MPINMNSIKKIPLVPTFSSIQCPKKTLPKSGNAIIKPICDTRAKYFKTLIFIVTSPLHLSYIIITINIRIVYDSQWLLIHFFLKICIVNRLFIVIFLTTSIRYYFLLYFTKCCTIRSEAWPSP